MADLTTLGVLFGYGVEATAGTKPAAFTKMSRCKSIGGIDLAQENIDVSCLEDLITKYSKGRQDTGGDWSVTFLSDGIAGVKTMMSAYATGATTGKSTWFEVYIPNMADGFYVIAEPGTKIPLPEIGDNAALEFPISLTIAEYRGLETAILPA